MKKVFVFISFLVLMAMPVNGQDDDGSSMMDRGMREFFEGLLLEMEPAFDDMRAFLEQMGPALQEILKDVQDWSAYEPPEVLENGDIIIRRKPPKEDEAKPRTEPLPQIEL